MAVPSGRSQASPLPIEARLVIGAIALRLFTAFIAFLAEITIPTKVDQRFSVLGQPNAFWDPFARYDSGWYYGIASNGYAYLGEGRNNLAFFPLYPTLMGWGGRLLGGNQADFYFAGVVISWVSFALAAMLLYRLARLDIDHQGAVRAVLYAGIFPAAYFFGVVYSESLFFVTLIGAVLAIRERRWVWSALAGAAMTATRVNGVMFLPALALIGWDAASTGRERRWALLAAIGGATGIAAYSWFVYSVSGHPFEWFDSITRWGYHPGGNPLSGLVAIAKQLTTRPIDFIATERMAPYDTLNAMAATGALLAVPFILQRFGRGYAAIVVLGLLLPLSSGQFEGLGRYCSVLFPLPILFGSMRGETRHLGLMTAFVMFYTLGLVLFGNVHPLF
jgi:mannosyltransferase PIG-V